MSFSTSTDRKDLVRMMNWQSAAAGNPNRREFFSWAQRGVGERRAGGVAAARWRSACHPDPQRRGRSAAASAREGQTRDSDLACGGVSQVDSFDYKPELEKFHGQPLGGDEKPDVFFGQVGLLRQSDWEFRAARPKRPVGLGPVSAPRRRRRRADRHPLDVRRDVEPHAGDVSGEHRLPAQRLSRCSAPGCPTAWAARPTTCRRSSSFPIRAALPAGGSINWTNGFLPARHQGVVIRSQGTPIDDLFPGHATDAATTEAASRRAAGEAEPPAPGRARATTRWRPASAATSWPRGCSSPCPRWPTCDRETAATQALYGLDRPRDGRLRPGAACWPGGCWSAACGSCSSSPAAPFGTPRINWDGHENMQQNHGQEAAAIDQPVAGLLRDLRQRGMLDDTLVLFTTEFGRTPFTQSAADVVGTGPRPQPVRLLRLAGRRRPEARHRLRRDRRRRLEGRREPRALARLPRHRAAPARHRPRAADLLPQRHPAAADRRAWRSGDGDTLLGGSATDANCEQPEESCLHIRPSTSRRRTSILLAQD